MSFVHSSSEDPLLSVTGIKCIGIERDCCSGRKMDGARDLECGNVTTRYGILGWRLI